jgi:hypothetical protein
MPAFFDLLREEPHPAVRVVLGHFIFSLHPSLIWMAIGGTEATGHEAEAKFQKKTQQYQVHPALARP